MTKSYNLAYFDQVEDDVTETKAWYKSKKNGLEKRFAEAIQQAILKLQKTPAAYAIRYKNIRIAYPVVFPYAIHFYIDEPKNMIVITAIIFAGRDPAFAKNRIS